MAPDISANLRLSIARRAAHRCEYCLLHEDDSFTPHQIDHIISRKHGGQSVVENLAFACIRCNAWKGSDIASLCGDSEVISRLFHPRRDSWSDHFRHEDGEIIALSEVGKATAKLLRLNLAGRILERAVLSRCGRYPR